MDDKDIFLLAELETYRRRAIKSQVELADLLRVSQGHLSKVMSGKAKLSEKFRQNASKLLIGTPSETRGDPEFETEVLRLLRTSESFRKLMHAAVEMHNHGQTPHG